MISTATALIHITDRLPRAQEPNTHTHTHILEQRYRTPHSLSMRHFDPIWPRRARFRRQTRLHTSEFLRLSLTLVSNTVEKWLQGHFPLTFVRDIFFRIGQCPQSKHLTPLTLSKPGRNSLSHSTMIYFDNGCWCVTTWRGMVCTVRDGQVQWFMGNSFWPIRYWPYTF